MVNSRLLIRLSIILNAFLVFYISFDLFKSGDASFEKPVQSSFQQSRNLESFPEGAKGSENESSFSNQNEQPSLNLLVDSEVKDGKVDKKISVKNVDMDAVPPPQEGDETAVDEEGRLIAEPPRFVQESMGVPEVAMPAAVIPTEPPDPPMDSLERKMYPDMRDCPTKPQVSIASQRGQYWVLENYIPAALSFRCDESITYTTHGDYTFLDNLEILTSRWLGPVSIGVYAPGTDFQKTVDTILYLRNCWAEGIKKYVTFHLIYHTDHIPKKIPTTDELLQRKVDCGIDPPQWVNVTTYRQSKGLLYPINVARNVARRTASTYFIFPSDVELYPSINFIPEFFKMLKRPDTSKTNLPRVFVFSIFEVQEKTSPPESKTELIQMLKSKEAIPFHQRVCRLCHQIPHSKEWLDFPINPGLSVSYIGKRLGTFRRWEPIYVGTHKEPLYDERLSWEGKSDKMTQMYTLCVRDYEFHILDNAFLVHRPGIKTIIKDTSRDKIVVRQTSHIRKHIMPEYKTLFGYKKDCTL